MIDSSHTNTNPPPCTLLDGAPLPGLSLVPDILNLKKGEEIFEAPYCRSQLSWEVNHQHILSHITWTTVAFESQCSITSDPTCKDYKTTLTSGTRDFKDEHTTSCWLC